MQPLQQYDVHSLLFPYNGRRYRWLLASSRRSSLNSLCRIVVTSSLYVGRLFCLRYFLHNYRFDIKSLFEHNHFNNLVVVLMPLILSTTFKEAQE